MRRPRYPKRGVPDHIVGRLGALVVAAHSSGGPTGSPFHHVEIVQAEMA